MPYVWERYGAVPEEVYAGLEYGEPKHDHYEMADMLYGFMKSVTDPERKKLSPVWQTGFNGILDAYFGKAPEKFTYEGKEYTPPVIRSIAAPQDERLCPRHIFHTPSFLSDMHTRSA